ncbi:MAG: DUF58 domain-containing protein [Chloroflexi bacterium]|nr:DUF58 domain-containing protein [Chloroflexota bacterium]
MNDSIPVRLLKKIRRREPIWIPLRSGAFRVMSRHWILIIAWVILTVFAFQTSSEIFFRLSYLILAFEIASFAWAVHSIATFRLERDVVTQRTQVGKVAEENFLIHNTGRMLKVWLEIRDDSELPAHRVSRVLNGLRAGVRWSWTVRTLCRRRGRFRLGPITIVTGDPFGLFILQRQLKSTQSAITVFPQTIDLPRFAPAMGQMSGGDSLQRRTHHVTTNVSGTREYAPGDSFNRIHWRSTARLERLIVKEFELDPSADVWLYLDMERTAQARLWYEEEILARDISSVWLTNRPQEIQLLPSTEEYMVTIAATIAKYYLANQRALGFAAYGHEREIVQPDRGERQLNRLLEVLAVLRAEGGIQFSQVLAQEATKLGRNNTLVTITPSGELTWVKSLREIKRRGLRVISVIVDSNSFGGRGETEAAAAELLASGIPTYIVREGDDLRTVLSQ